MKPGQRLPAVANPRAALLLILLFWSGTFAVLSARSMIAETGAFLSTLLPRLAITGSGAFLCGLMALAFSSWRLRFFPLVVLVAFASALLCSAILAGLQLWIYGIWFPGQGSPTGSTGFVLWTLFWFGYFLAWTGTFLALAYHREARLHEQQLANMRALAHEAQAAALRYQLNPHFLFNTINSVSAFVLERRPEEAERMLSNLSEFLRTTMSMDPSATVTLAEEVALQQAYLEIEKVRFSNRVHVEVDVPAQLADTEVPGLLLQPLVENAVRHGLGRCEAEVTLRIEAARDGEHVLIRVSDDAIGATRGGGTGIGLRNVRERLQAHYGDGARLTFGPLPGRGYSAEVRLPLSRRGNAGSFTAFEASL